MFIGYDTHQYSINTKERERVVGCDGTIQTPLMGAEIHVKLIFSLAGERKSNTWLVKKRKN